MGRVINIGNKLDREPRFLVIDEDHQYKVDCTKNAVTKFMALDESGMEATDYMDVGLDILIGSKARKEIESLELPFYEWTTIFKAVIALATNKDLEDVDELFRDGSKKEEKSE